MKMMHPHTHVVVVIRLKALSSQFKPFLDSLRVQPWINAQLDLFKNQKRSIHHTWKHFLVPGKLVMLWNVKHCTLSSNAGKKVFQIRQSSKLTVSQEKEVKPGTAASCSTSRQTTRWDLKKANCYTLLRWITWLKTVNSDSDRQFPFPT